MNNLEIALSYLSKRLSVIPLYSPEMVRNRPSKSFLASLESERKKNQESDKPLSEREIYNMVLTRQCKKPCLTGWKEYQNRIATEDEIIAWFNQNPEPNIAIITGKVSNIVVFDLDSQDAIEYAEEQGGFPDTAKAKTWKGRHVIMKYPGFEVKNQTKKDIGEDKKLDIDIRGDGGYIVAPPSIHGSGHQYTWEPGFSIFEIDPAECTPWMIDYLRNIQQDSIPKNETQTEKKQTEASVTETGDDKAVDKFSRLLREGCSEGERNHTATILIGHLFKTGMKESNILELVKIWNMSKVKPPLDLSELKKTFDSVKSLEDRNKKKPINIEAFLDNQSASIAEYNQTYFRVQFAGDTLTNLQSKMNGGFIGGRLYLLGGIPSSAKTALTNNIADNICLNGYPVVFLSYDDGRAELRYRTFSRFSQYFIEDFNLRTVSDLTSIFSNTNIRRIIPNKYVIQEMIPVEKWPELIDQIIRKHKIAPVIFVDYLRKLRTELKTGDERLRVDDIISKLTDLAKTFNIPIIAISELARDSYKSGQRLSMASFKESGTIEYESSWLGILGAVEEGEDGEYKLKENWETIINHDGNIDLIIFKAKRGTGGTGKVPLKVYKDKMTVKDRIENNATDDQEHVIPKVSKFRS